MTKRPLEERLQEAKDGKNLWEHYRDKDWEVRYQVALHDFTLDKLAKDKDWRVRAAVASRIGGAYGLDEDAEQRVRISAEMKEQLSTALDTVRNELLETITKGGDKQCNKCNSQTG